MKNINSNKSESKILNLHKSSQIKNLNLFIVFLCLAYCLLHFYLVICPRDVYNLEITNKLSF